MVQALHLKSVGFGLLKGAAVLTHIVFIALIVALWETVGAFIGIGLFVQYGLEQPASAGHFYQLAWVSGALAFGVHGATMLWPFSLLFELRPLRFLLRKG
jgi:hypothetical protein